MVLRVGSFSLFFLLLTLTQINWASAKSSSRERNPILNFASIQAGVYRGGLPGEQGVRYLKNIGVKTIVTLLGDNKETDAEIRLAHSLGIRVLSYPLTNFFNTNEKSINGALSALADPSLYPVFLHCRHGRDRTGVVAAIHRVEHQGWAPRRAYKEMKDMGFKWIRFPLKNYFKKRTGYSD